MSKGMIRESAWAMYMALVMAMPVAAHHSFAVYDATQTKTAQATIKEFNFGAPHSSATFMIIGSDSKSQPLNLQGAAPAALKRAGFSPKDFAKGTKVEISWFPVKDGGPAGALRTLKLADGRTFIDHESDRVGK